MKVDKDIEAVIDELVCEYIPEGYDELFHVDRRAMMTKIIHTLCEKGKVPMKLETIVWMCKDWKQFLAERAAYSN